MNDPMTFAYADPPYLGLGKKFYGDLHPEAAQWDSKEKHIDLLETLNRDYPDGWALSCNPSDLSWLLPHAGNVRVCAWVKTFHQIRPLCSVQYSWEPVLLSGGRVIKNRKPMVRDWLACPRAMKKGLKGAKPDLFNEWVLQILGWQVGDQVHDLFPGSNGLTQAIERLEAAAHE
jgi:hypothetical protein